MLMTSSPLAVNVPRARPVADDLSADVAEGTPSSCIVQLCTQGQALAEDNRVLLVMLSRTINPIMVWRGQLAWRGVLSHTVATGLGGGEFLA